MYKTFLDNDGEERVQINQCNLEILDASKYLAITIDRKLKFK